MAKNAFSKPCFHKNCPELGVAYCAGCNSYYCEKHYFEHDKKNDVGRKQKPSLADIQAYELNNNAHLSVLPAEHRQNFKRKMRRV